MERLEEEKHSWFPTGTLKSEMTTNLLQFLCSALETVMRWHSSPAIYEKECFNFPGFLTVFRKGTDVNNKMNRLDYVNYRHVCHKWHFRLTKSVITCLESKNYCQMRTSLIVLTKILPNFPRMTQIGMAIERRVDKLSKEEKDKRPDIYALVILYAGQLMSKKPTWVQETEFHIKEDAPKMSNLNSVQEKRRELQKVKERREQQRKKRIYTGKLTSSDFYFIDYCFYLL
ncbi:THO complex subunit 2 [Biomphalaria glabrata]|nr:THO complex subunit 2 [Biomphalaria glabrata]